MNNRKRAGWLAAVVGVIGLLLVLDYFLPSTDVVRIVDTDVKRMDGADEAADGSKGGSGTRDVRFINAALPDNSPHVYRNDEAPWYLKFDSGNLQTEAQDLRSTRDNPRWVAVHHYGWRFSLLSAFPNALAVTPANGPGDHPMPWSRILAGVPLVAMAAFGWRWQRRRALRAGTSRQMAVDDDFAP